MIDIKDSLFPGMVNRMSEKRKQTNVRADDEFLQAVGELIRADHSSALPPSASDVIRKAVFEARDRLRKRAGPK